MGILDWIFGVSVLEIEPEEAYAKLNATEPTLVLDVRQPVETRSGTVPGAKLIPLTQLRSRMDELPRDRQIITICASSHRSPIAARQLARAGFEVIDVRGGLNAWAAAGLPIEQEENEE